ncbi:MAG TPA: cupin [Marinilabiliaceae bacterium]|jgi:quercetin dioxygenase-like cupin family protein|nr:cupin [Marinilabiliaceae bacterium]
MKTQIELVQLQTGASFKVLQVSGKAGLEMPLHYSTQEAVVIVLEGSALLLIDKTEHLLLAGRSFIIPARQHHSLQLKQDFKALVIMAEESDIEFVK